MHVARINNRPSTKASTDDRCSFCVSPMTLIKLLLLLMLNRYNLYTNLTDDTSTVSRQKKWTVRATITSSSIWIAIACWDATGATIGGETQLTMNIICSVFLAVWMLCTMGLHVRMLLAFIKVYNTMAEAMKMKSNGSKNPMGQAIAQFKHMSIVFFVCGATFMAIQLVRLTATSSEEFVAIQVATVVMEVCNLFITPSLSICPQ